MAAPSCSRFLLQTADLVGDGLEGRFAGLQLEGGDGHLTNSNGGPTWFPEAGRFVRVRANLVPQASSDLRHVELRLGHAAIGTHPIIGYVSPARAGRNPLVRQTLGLLVDEAAGATLEGLERLGQP